MSKTLRFIGILLFLSGAARGFAQVRDAGLWMNVNVEKKITANLSAAFTEEVRLYENLTETGTVLSDLGIEYDLNKRFRAGVSVRYSCQKRLDDSYDQRFTYYVDLQYREKVKPFLFLVRMRYQSQYTDICTSEEGFVPENTLRAKATVKYLMEKKTRPFISFEGFFPTEDMALRIDQWRLCGGVEYAFNRKNSIEVSYMIRKRIKNEGTIMDWIPGISYSYTF